ncbi:MAG: helix-turn-helix domain-containing protein [Chloroflexi bacterium]|nr:helix-turn-helix domain-containing protein [Chloroflexota bacterium]
MGEFISTDDVSERQRLAYWNDLVCHGCEWIEVTPLGEAPFFGAISTDQLAFVRLLEVISHPALVTRSKQAIIQSTAADIKVTYQLSGESVVNQANRTAHLGPGDWVLLDCTRPFSLTHTTDHSKHSALVLQLPKRVFCARLPNIEGLIGYTLSSKTGLGRVTYDFIQSVRREVAGMKPATRSHVAETLVDLLATNLSETFYPATAAARSQAVTLLEVKSYIHEHLHDPQLSVWMIAKALNISKSYLHLLFRGENTTVSQYIWDLRLEKCRADLANPLHRHQTITEIAFAWGFNSSTHFSRMFKERYGLPARAYRC